MIFENLKHCKQIKHDNSNGLNADNAQDAINKVAELIDKINKNLASMSTKINELQLNKAEKDSLEEAIDELASNINSTDREVEDLKMDTINAAINQTDIIDMSNDKVTAVDGTFKGAKCGKVIMFTLKITVTEDIAQTANGYTLFSLNPACLTSLTFDMYNGSLPYGELTNISCWVNGSGVKVYGALPKGSYYLRGIYIEG